MTTERIPRYRVPFCPGCGLYPHTHGWEHRPDCTAQQIPEQEALDNIAAVFGPHLTPALPYMPAVEEHGPGLMVVGPIPRPPDNAALDFCWWAGDGWCHGFGMYHKNRRLWHAFGECLGGHEDVVSPGLFDGNG